MKKSVLRYYSTESFGFSLGRKSSLCAIALLLAIALPETASADSITVPNFSFELPAATTPTVHYVILGTTNSTGAADPLTDWNYTTNNVKGYGVVSTSTLTTPGTSDGSQGAYLQVYNNGNFGTLTTADSLGTITANTLYTLTVAVGAPATWVGNPAVGGGTKTEGKTGAQVNFSLTGNGVAFATQSVAANLVSEGTLVDYTVSFTTGASGGDIGQSLGISLEALKAFYPGSVDPGVEAAIFDNVRLTAVSTVPEPGTWALLLGGIGFLIALVRRNKIA